MVWVVVRQREKWSDYGDSRWDEITVQDLAYPTRELAEKRAKHLNDEKLVAWASVHPVKIHQEPMAPVYALPPMPRMPPSAVYTKEDPSVKLQVAYDVPRRVWAGQPSLSDVVCETWAAWAQRAPGVQPSDVPEPSAIAQLFEESPSGTMRLFPRELPEPAR